MPPPATAGLHFGEIERYASSLIWAARNNPRGVPALEASSIGERRFAFPNIEREGRLERHQELATLECTVRLLVARRLFRA